MPFLLLCRYVNSICGSPPLPSPPPHPPHPRGSSIPPSPSSLHHDIYSSAGSYTAEELGSHRSNNLSVVHLVRKWCMWKCVCVCGGASLFKYYIHTLPHTHTSYFTHYCRRHCGTAGTPHSFSFNIYPAPRCCLVLCASRLLIRSDQLCHVTHCSVWCKHGLLMFMWLDAHSISMVILYNRQRRSLNFFWSLGKEQLLLLVPLAPFG